MKKTILATLIAATSFGSFAAPVETNLLDPRDKSGYEMIVELSELGNGNGSELQEVMENGTLEDKNAFFDKVQADIREMDKNEQFAALLVMNNITVSQKYDSLLDQLVNGGNYSNFSDEFKTAYKEFQASDYYGGDRSNADIKEFLESKQPAPTPVEPIDVIVDPIKAPIEIDPILPVNPPVDEEPIKIDPIDVVIDPIKEPIGIDPIRNPIEQKIADNIRMHVTDVMENGTTEDKIATFNQAMRVSGKDVEIIGTPYIEADGSQTFTVKVDGVEHTVTESDFNKAAKEKQQENADNRQEQSFIDPITNEPIHKYPDAPIEDAPILIGDGKHEERKEARETAREERQAERKDKGGVIVRPIDELPQPTPEEPINPEKPMPIHDGENPFDGSKAEAAREALDTSREDAREEGKTVTDELQERVEEIKSTYKGDIAQQAAAQTQSQIDELYALGNQNASDIETLFNEVDRLDSRIDQTQALNAATVNARPMVTNGMTAFGAGVGYAGSEAALAIGVAHSFEDTGWSASGTLAASSDDVVIGAGTQYAF
ncbi:YadA-like family protein [Vibrio splendidus]